MDINKLVVHTVGDITGVMRLIEGESDKFKNNEVLTYWSVSKYLFEELKKYGELVDEINGTYVYGKVSDGTMSEDETLNIIFNKK